MRNISVCRDCFVPFYGNFRCPKCYSPRTISDPELFELSIAHIDCDAFYASVEKRENSELSDVPVIVGGSNKGVVATCCYIARIKGVKSAMPIFKAKQLCPDAIILKPRLNLYSEVSKKLMNEIRLLTPIIEPIALDEAFIDMSGTKKLHKEPPVVQLVRLAAKIERTLRITISIGLSYNKFLSKLASDINKPRGFTVIGRSNFYQYIEHKPTNIFPGVGSKTLKCLQNDGIYKIGDIQSRKREDLVNSYGILGNRLYDFSRGIDERRIKANKVLKSISSEITLETPTCKLADLKKIIWQLSEKISYRAKSKNVFGKRITLKLKISGAPTTSITKEISIPNNLAETIFSISFSILESKAPRHAIKLVGLRLDGLENEEKIIETFEFFSQNLKKQELLEQAMDQIRTRFGKKILIKGRSL